MSNKMKKNIFLPTTQEEMLALGWSCADVILVTGDSYIDSPFMGIAVIGRVLADAGYRVGIIAQPDMDSALEIGRLGEPRLFWGVSGGSVDSMVANCTASGKRRKGDDFTPGGVNDRRPDRAVIAYTNLIRQHFKGTSPVVLGGIEASLRRISHYDFWSNRVRRSILFDAKADFLVYGMGERSVLELAACLDNGGDPEKIRGIAYAAKEKRADYIELPPHETVVRDKNAFTEMFDLFYKNNDPVHAKGLCQRQDTRYLIQNPPSLHLTQGELDALHALDFQRDLHPHYRQEGTVKALDTIRFSITTHRGCYGECNFCAIAVHQGRTVLWRSEASILAEAKTLTGNADFKGNIMDAGGPTANMYGFECEKKLSKGSCLNKRCLFPDVCPKLSPDHGPQTRLLASLRQVPKVKRVFVASGIRYDLLLADRKHGGRYLSDVVAHHVSGQMKIAPEHTEERILSLMGKPGRKGLLAFKEMFDRLTAKVGKKQFLTYYLIAAHPGCTEKEMAELSKFTRDHLGVRPEQVQIFTPTPGTWSSLMYHTGKNPFTGEKIHVERDTRRKEQQKRLVTGKGHYPKGAPADRRPKAASKADGTSPHRKRVGKPVHEWGEGKTRRKRPSGSTRPEAEMKEVRRKGGPAKSRPAKSRKSGRSASQVGAVRTGSPSGGSRKRPARQR